MESVNLAAIAVDTLWTGVHVTAFLNLIVRKECTLLR